MSRRCLLLFTGGLDTLLAGRLLLDQGIEVRALFVHNILGCGAKLAEAGAARLGIPCESAPLSGEAARWLRDAWPQVSHGPNPCARCRSEMLVIARTYLARDTIEWVATGEVVGQRPGQSRKDLAGAAHRAGLDDRVLRPLSAKLLPPTLAEREGWVDRQGLLDLSGRGRTEQLARARKLGWTDVPPPGAGCPLDRAEISARVADLLAQPALPPTAFELLAIGRHFRFDAAAHVVLGRNAAENDALKELVRRQAGECWLVEPEDFTGPTALVVGQARPEALEFAGGLLYRFARLTESRAALATAGDGRIVSVPAAPLAIARDAQPIG